MIWLMKKHFNMFAKNLNKYWTAVVALALTLATMEAAQHKQQRQEKNFLIHNWAVLEQWLLLIVTIIIQCYNQMRIEQNWTELNKWKESLVETFFVHCVSFFSFSSLFSLCCRDCFIILGEKIQNTNNFICIWFLPRSYSTSISFQRFLSFTPI